MRTESTHFFCRLRGKRTFRELPAGFSAQGTDLRLHCRDRRQADTEFAHADTNKDGYCERIAGYPPAHSHAPARWLGPLDSVRNKPEYRRVQTVHLSSELRMPPVHGKGVLREIIGSD